MGISILGLSTQRPRVTEQKQEAYTPRSWLQKSSQILFLRFAFLSTSLSIYFKLAFPFDTVPSSPSHRQVEVSLTWTFGAVFTFSPRSETQLSTPIWGLHPGLRQLRTSGLEGGQMQQGPAGGEAVQKQRQRKHPSSRKKGSWLHKNMSFWITPRLIFPKQQTHFTRYSEQTASGLGTWKRWVHLTHLVHLDSDTQSRPREVTAVLKLSLFAFPFFNSNAASLLGTQVISQKEKNLIISYKHIIL